MDGQNFGPLPVSCDLQFGGQEISWHYAKHPDKMPGQIDTTKGNVNGPAIDIMVVQIIIRNQKFERKNSLSIPCSFE
jgi:hypothetical protein